MNPFRILRDMFVFIGIYESFSTTWRYFEELELGYTVTTIIDGVICMIFAIAITWLITILAKRKGE